MKEVRLPSGRVIKVSEYDAERILVEFFEEVLHKLVLDKSLSPEQVDEEINRYLYGYVDENGEKVEGYFDRIRKAKTKAKREWWR